MAIADIVKLIGAIAAVVGTSFTILNSKGCILRRIERKEEQIRRIDHELVVRYGLHRNPFHPETWLDARRKRLSNQIDSLKRLL